MFARVDVPVGGRVSLPASHASCHVFAEAERGWWCFLCARGGRIYDLASLLEGGAWGRDLRGEAFWQLRRIVEAAVR